MYLVTAAGRHAWESQDLAVPQDYRRLLWRIDVQGDTRALKALLAEHPEHLVRDWLRELQELGFLKTEPRSPHADTTLPLAINEPALRAGAQASSLLSTAGAYLAPVRPGVSRTRKAPSETRILVVEDDPDQLALADLRVSSAGYQVQAALSVSQMMSCLMRDGAPELMLLDVLLPDGNGFEVLSKLRRHPEYSAMPIVMLTVVSDARHVARGLALGADGYVTKPYSKSRLLGVITEVLAQAD